MIKLYPPSDDAKPVLESDVEGYLRSELQRIGGKYRKCVWQSRIGAPDDFWMLPGMHGWVETKRPRGARLAAHQKREIDDMRAAGCDVQLCYSVADVDRFIVALVVRCRIGSR